MTHILYQCPKFTNHPVYNCVCENISNAMFDVLLCETTPSQ
jgi:hypothetical protein